MGDFSSLPRCSTQLRGLQIAVPIGQVGIVSENREDEYMILPFPVTTPPPPHSEKERESAKSKTVENI